MSKQAPFLITIHIIKIDDTLLLIHCIKWLIFFSLPRSRSSSDLSQEFAGLSPPPGTNPAGRPPAERLPSVTEPTKRPAPEDGSGDIPTHVVCGQPYSAIALPAHFRGIILLIKCPGKEQRGIRH